MDAPDSYLMFLHCITFKVRPCLSDAFYYSWEGFISSKDGVRYVQELLLPAASCSSYLQ